MIFKNANFLAKLLFNSKYLSYVQVNPTLSKVQLKAENANFLQFHLLLVPRVTRGCLARTMQVNSRSEQ